MRKGNLELKVGLFVFAALGVLTVLVFKAGDFYLKPGYAIRLIFNSVSGIDKDSPVRFAGVTVGQVKEVRVVRSPEGQTQVELVTHIDQGIFIEEDADARISSLGLLGEKYVEILPGKGGAKALSDGGALTGKPAFGTDQIIESGSRLISKMELTIDNVNEMVADPKFKASVKNTFGNAENLTKDLSSMSEDLKDAIKSAKTVLGRLRDGEGSIGRLLKDDTMARNLEAFSAEIKKNPWKLLKRD